VANPITWQNVATPDLRGSMDGLRIAGAAFDRAGTGLTETLARFDTARKEVAAAQLIDNSLNFTTPEELRAAQADGRLFNGVNRGLLTPAAATALDGRATNLLSQATSQQALSTAREMDPRRITFMDGQIRGQDQSFRQSEESFPLIQEGRRINNAGGLISNATARVGLANATDGLNNRREGEGDTRSARAAVLSLDDATNPVVALARLQRMDLSDGARALAEAQLAARWPGMNPGALRSSPEFTDALATLGPERTAAPVPVRYGRNAALVALRDAVIDGTPEQAAAASVARLPAALPANVPYANRPENAGPVIPNPDFNPNRPENPQSNPRMIENPWHAARGQIAPASGRVNPTSAPTANAAAATPTVAPGQAPAAPQAPLSGSAPGATVARTEGSVRAEDLQTPEAITQRTVQDRTQVQDLLDRVTRRQELDQTAGVASRYAAAMENPGDVSTALATLRGRDARFASLPEDVVLPQLREVADRLAQNGLPRNYAVAAQLLLEHGMLSRGSWVPQFLNGTGWENNITRREAALDENIRLIRQGMQGETARAISKRDEVRTNLRAADEALALAASSLQRARERAAVDPGAASSVRYEERIYNRRREELERAMRAALGPANEPPRQISPPAAAAPANGTTPVRNSGIAALTMGPALIQGVVERARRPAN